MDLIKFIKFLGKCYYWFFQVGKNFVRVDFHNALKPVLQSRSLESESRKSKVFMGSGGGDGGTTPPLPRD